MNFARCGENPLDAISQKQWNKKVGKIKFFNANRLVKISYGNAIQEELALPKQTL